MSDTLFCTACDDAFVPGCKVMLYSMHQHIPNFARHPVKIFFDNELAPLSQANQDALRRVSPNVTFEEAQSQVYQDTEIETERYSMGMAYLSLEAFRQTDFDSVLYFDTDMLCLGDISDILPLSAEYDFVACEFGRADGQGRWAARLGPRHGRWGRRKWFGVWGRRMLKINCGLFLVGRRQITDANYRALLKLVRRTRGKRKLLDQWVINTHFGRKDLSLYLLPNEYNWRALERLETHPLDDIKIIHYSGYTQRLKPWEPGAPSDQKAYRLWRDYAERVEELETRGERMS